MQAMRIMGIDPGVGRVGWGVVDYQKGKQTVVAFGCIETKVNSELSKRLVILSEELSQLIDTYFPDAMAVEELFFNTNAKTALMVGHGRGVILLAAAQKNIPVFSYTPLEVKIAITGYGRAEKAQVGQMIKVLLKLEKIPKPDDTADALAIALAHAFSAKRTYMK